MNSKVPRPASRSPRAASNTLRRSATPEKTADNGTNANAVRCARRRATVVLPHPGGPQRIIEVSRPDASMRPIGPSAPNR